MKKSKRVLAASLSGAFAIVLTSVSSVFAMIGGFVLFFVHSIVFGAGLLTMLAGLVLFVTFIMSIVAVAARSFKLSLASAILCVISTATIVCCMGIHFRYGFLYVFPSLAAVCAFGAFILFAVNCALTPVKTKYSSTKEFESEKSQTDIYEQIKLLDEKRSEQLITEQEYAAQKYELLVPKQSVEKTTSIAEEICVTKRQRVCLFTIPTAIMVVICIILIPIIYFGVCKYAYQGLLRNMEDMRYGKYCVHYSSFEKFNELLPENYKDVAEIRQELEDYRYFDCMHALESGYFDLSEETRGARARFAYAKLMEWQKADPRWGFKSITELSEALISGASWQGDGYDFKCVYDEEAKDYVFDTSLPYHVPDEEERIEYYCTTEYNDGEGYVLIGYDVLGNYSWQKTDRKCFKVSNFRYDTDKHEFTIDVYCYETEETYTMTCTENYEWSDFEW